MRAFLAVDVAGEEARARVGALLAQLREIRGLRVVPPHQLHFTLKFFEDLTEARLAASKGAATRAASAVSSFSLNLFGLGTFPPGRPARVLWVGSSDGSERLDTLAGAVEKELAVEGFAPEMRPFAPHLTLARVKDSRSTRDVSALVSTNVSFEGGTIEVKELVLYQSVLGPSGAVHTPLGRFPLAPR
jgi:2'-5' RNA ligase